MSTRQHSEGSSNSKPEVIAVEIGPTEYVDLVGRKLDTLEVSSRYVPSSDDIAMHIRQVRESAPLLFSAIVGSISVEDWTKVASQNFKALSTLRS